MELVAIILVIAAVAAAEVLIFGKYALKGIYYSASVNKAEVYEGETLELTEVVENRCFAVDKDGAFSFTLACVQQEGFRRTDKRRRQYLYSGRFFAEAPK